MFWYLVDEEEILFNVVNVMDEGMGEMLLLFAYLTACISRIGDGDAMLVFRCVWNLSMCVCKYACLCAYVHIYI